jgi:hypothetical protein
VSAVEQRPEPKQAPSTASIADAIPPGARRRTATPRQMLAAITAGSLVLALLASSDLPSWGEELGDGLLATSLRRAATAWNDEMQQLGLTAPHEALRAAMRWLRDRQWR